MPEFQIASAFVQFDSKGQAKLGSDLKNTSEQAKNANVELGKLSETASGKTLGAGSPIFTQANANAVQQATAPAASFAFSAAAIANTYQMEQFGLAIKDSTAVIGRTLLPYLEAMTYGIRAVGDVLINLPGPVKDLIGGSLALAVGLGLTVAIGSRVVSTFATISTAGAVLTSRLYQASIAAGTSAGAASLGGAVIGASLLKGAGAIGLASLAIGGVAGALSGSADVGIGAGLGAAVGATIGSFIPVIGTVVGGAVGSAIGGLIGYASGGSKSSVGASGYSAGFTGLAEYGKKVQVDALNRGVDSVAADTERNTKKTADLLEAMAIDQAGFQRGGNFEDSRHPTVRTAYSEDDYSYRGTS